MGITKSAKFQFKSKLIRLKGCFNDKFNEINELIFNSILFADTGGRRKDGIND